MHICNAFTKVLLVADENACTANIATIIKSEAEAAESNAVVEKRSTSDQV